jgi:hypothetical protein
VGSSPAEGGQTQIVGQQSLPSTTVPPGPAGPLYRPTTSAPTNSLAVVSLVAAILSFFFNFVPIIGGAIVAIVAIVTGQMARNQIRQGGEQGMWMATAGMVIGIIHLVLLAMLVLGVLFVIFILGIRLFGPGGH